LLGRLTELGIFTTIQKMFQYKITQHPDACKRIQVTFNEIGVAQFATCGEVVGAKHGAKKVPTAGASKVQLLVTDLVTCASAWMVSIEKTPNTIAFLSGAALHRSNIYFNSSGIERKRHQEI
jgi:hypothetical protein